MFENWTKKITKHDAEPLRQACIKKKAKHPGLVEKTLQPQSTTCSACGRLGIIASVGVPPLEHLQRN